MTTQVVLEFPSGLLKYLILILNQVISSTALEVHNPGPGILPVLHMLMNIFDSFQPDSTNKLINSLS